MDFGVVGLENGGGSLECSDTGPKHKWYRSSAEDGWGEFKVAKTSDDFSRSCLLRSNSHILHSDCQQMLSFSSPNSQTVTLPFYPSAAYSRIPGYGSEGLSGENMHVFKGPFAPSQLRELELQKLIFKYIKSNVPVPSCLLNPIRKALDSAGFSTFPGLRPNYLGWDAFHLGFSNNTDPEPGRCRRTDGKKWRCSRDAVADQKYCERHMNRGRHRSRKPVEGQAGHSVSGNMSSNTKLPVASVMPAATVLGGGESNNLGLPRKQLTDFLPGRISNPPPASHQFETELLAKTNGSQRNIDNTNLSILPPSLSRKDRQNPREDSQADFGTVCSDSLLNPLNKSSSLLNCRNYYTIDDLNDGNRKSRHPLRQFMDDWPRNRTESSAVSWSNIDVHSDRTQLSMSIPAAAASDYLSTTSSPINEKLGNDSALRLLPELEATQMGLGQNNRQGNWIGSWQSSVGGPLGEVLHTTNGNGDCKDTSALNLLTEGWASSPRMVASSPTGVLQKTAFSSLSNSSAGSSPRTENSKTQEGVGIFNGLLGSTLLNPTLPAL